MSDASTALAVAPASSSDVSELFVLFKVGGGDFALPANQILQMESYTGATRVPGAPAFVPGIVQLRGRMVPVVDLRARFGLEPTTVTPDSRVIVGEKDGRAVALLSDFARDVVRIAPSQRRAPPRLVDQGALRFVESMVELAGRTVMVLDFARVIGEETIHVE